MTLFRVSFMNRLPDATGHDHTVCQREIDIATGTEQEAIAQAIREFERREAIPHWKLRARNIECAKLTAPSGKEERSSKPPH